VERIERVKRRDGTEPVRLSVLPALEREQQREERERRRRDPRGSAPSSASRAAPSDADVASPRLDVRA
jgi:hypothetical protein